MTKLHAGDRVAFAAKFLKNTGQFTGRAPQRRGTIVSHDGGFHARVIWDDFSPIYAEKQYGADYVAEVVTNGELVCAANVAKVGSARFACNDL